MFAVVVLIAKPRNKHCVVPEKYIFGLDKMEADLKTWGANKTHNHLIFWNKALLNDNIAPDTAAHPPDFQVEKYEIFPPQTDSACFLGRVKRFFSQYLFNIYYNLNFF